MFIYNLIICGGTFDRLHPGHKAFLREAFSKGERVVIGITSDEYVRAHKKDLTILPFSQRKKGVEDFLLSEGLLQRAKIAKIDSRFDQTQVGDDSDAALLVSEETYNVGQEINKERESLSLQPLPLLIAPLQKDEKSQKISSSTMRKFILPQAMRQLLSKPFGPLITDFPREALAHPEKIITVGDITTKKMLEKGITPKLSVVDFVVERHRQYNSFQELGFGGNEKVYTLANPAGTIAKETWNILGEIVDKLNSVTNSILFVDGEEDLLVIPIILLFPVGFSIFYGQPGKGLVTITITQQTKQKVQRLLLQFTYTP